MSKQPLAGLPLASSDFASACMTARVPRQHLTLVVVRMIATAPDGSIDVGTCQSAAFLFDSRHRLPAFCTAVHSTVTSCLPKALRLVLDTTGVLLFTRMPVDDTTSDMLVLPTDKGRAVEEEMTVADGMLRSAVHVSGALRAWQRQCSVRSAVCIRDAVLAWNLHSCQRAATRKSTSATDSVGFGAGEEVSPEHTIALGLQKLTGGGRPTATVPGVCECSRQLDCDCFMRRAMYRGGTTWLIVYAVLPPPHHRSTARGWEGRLTAPPSLGSLLHNETVPLWVNRLVDGTGSESESTCADNVGGRLLGDICPSAWPKDVPFIVRPWWEDASNSDATLSASESGDVFGVSGDVFGVSNVESSLMTGALQLAVMWANHQPRRRIVALLADASRVIGPYYGPPLCRVIAVANGPKWFVRLLRRASSLDSGLLADDLYHRFRRHDTAARAIVSLVRHLTAPERAGIGTIEACEYTGYAAAVVTLALHCFHEHIVCNNEQPGNEVTANSTTTEITCPRVNMWSRYTVFDPCDTPLLL